MKKRTVLTVIVLAVLSGVVLAQTGVTSRNINNGFQALLYHAVRLEETFRHIDPIGMAVEEFGKAARDPAQAGEANLMLGLIYSYLQRPGTALGYYLEFAQLQPKDAWVQALMGDLYVEMGRLDEAERSYRLALEASSEEESLARVHYGLGTVALERGEYSQAREAFELALDGAQDFFDARLGLGKSLYYLGQYEEAIEVLELGQLQAPRSLSLLEYLGWSYEAVGRTDQAAHVFSRMEELRGVN